jgi:hypothetical protein
VCLIDVLARLVYSKPTEKNASAAWDEFVSRYLPRYAGHANALYRGFRSAISHNYSLGDLRLTDGSTNALRHWTTEEGELVLHLESFIDDLDTAWQKFYGDVESDDAVRKRVLGRVRRRPLLGILGGEHVEVSTSVAHGISIAGGGFNPTRWGPAQAASGASWPVPPSPPMPSVTFECEKAIPKRKRKKRR